MKKLILICVLFITSLACLVAPTPTPSVNLVEAVVALTLTAAAVEDAPRVYLPGIVTLPPPAVGAPTMMATYTPPPSSTSLSITVAPLPSKTPTNTPDSATVPNPVPSLGADQRAVTYSVTGDAPVVRIYFTNQNGATESDLFSLPFERTIVFKQGATLDLLAENMGDTGTVICEIIMNDKVLKTSSASGPRQIAGCIDAVAE
jgi:hypothetical protein